MFQQRVSLMEKVVFLSLHSTTHVCVPALFPLHVLETLRVIHLAHDDI